MDLCGTSRQEGIGKENYFMLIIADYSKLTWVAFLKEKAEAFEKFKIFKSLTENQTGNKLKAVRLDRGGKFCQVISRNFVINMGSRENTQSQELHNKME